MSNQFNYTYSAPTEEERKEIDSIRRKYAPQEQTETKLQRLRRLDKLVRQPPIFGLIAWVLLDVLFLV